MADQRCKRCYFWGVPCAGKGVCGCECHEPQDAAPAPKCVLTYAKCPTPDDCTKDGRCRYERAQTEKGGDANALSRGSLARAATPATHVEAGARVAGAPFVSNLPEHKESIEHIGGLLGQICEPVAQPGAGGDPTEADMQRMRLTQQARAERDAAKMLNMDVDELRKVQGQLRSDAEPAAGQGAEQSWGEWLATLEGKAAMQGNYLGTNHRTREIALAYAAHVTKGLEARLAELERKCGE